MAIPKPEEWIAAYAKVQVAADRDILALLRSAYADIDQQLKSLAKQKGIGAAVRREQLLTIKRSILRQQAIVFRRVGSVITARRLEAAARAVALGSRIDSVLLSSTGNSGVASALKDSLTAGLERTVEVAITRMTQSQYPLAQRIYRTEVWMNDRVGRMVESALARGLSAREFAAEARSWFNPNTPGGVRYASMRLARSEINNAFHAISVNNALDKPWVEGMKWQLSKSHPKPDECDTYAKGHSPGMGEGLYLPRDVPRKPHPHCFCYVTPEVVDEDVFLDKMLAGKYDTYLSKSLGYPVNMAG